MWMLYKDIKCHHFLSLLISSMFGVYNHNPTSNSTQVSNGGNICRNISSYSNRCGATLSSYGVAQAHFFIGIFMHKYKVQLFSSITGLGGKINGTHISAVSDYLKLHSIH